MTGPVQDGPCRVCDNTKRDMLDALETRLRKDMEHILGELKRVLGLEMTAGWG